MKRPFGIAVILFALTNLFAPGHVVGASRSESQDAVRTPAPASVTQVETDLVALEMSTATPLHLEPIPTDAPLPNRAFDSPSDTGVSLASADCSVVSSKQPLEIPDDGSWIQVCYSDPYAPPKGTVTEVHVKYVLDHPESSELEIQLTRSDTDAIQTLWNRGTAAKGTELGKARSVRTFKGFVAQSEWRLQIRDTVPSKKGYLKTFTIRPNYAPTGPLAIQKAGSPAKPGSLFFPQGTLNSKTPDRNPNKLVSSTPTPKKSEITPPISSKSTAAPATRTSWQTIKNETLEGSFPNCGPIFQGACWTRSGETTDPGGNPREYLWADHNWKPHSGSWAACPRREVGMHVTLLRATLQICTVG